MSEGKILFWLLLIVGILILRLVYIVYDYYTDVKIWNNGHCDICGGWWVFKGRHKKDVYYECSKCHQAICIHTIMTNNKKKKR